MKDKCCKGACKCACKDKPNAVVLNDVEQLRKFSGEIYKDMAVRADKLGRMFKALKLLADFLTEEQNELKTKYEDLNSLLEKPEAKPEKKVVGEDPCETLVRALFTRSKYDFSGVESFTFDGNRDEDTDDTIAFDLVVFRTTSSQADSSSTIVSTTAEKRTVYLYPDMNKSVAEFDKAVGSMAFCRPPLKESRPKKEEPKCEKTGKCEHPCKEQGKAGRCPVSKTITLKPKVAPCKRKPVVPVIEDMKKTILECSKYAVPSSRVRFVAYRVDPKHGNFVYEVRFYQKSTKSVPVEKQSYEPAYLNVRMYGDRDDLLAKRFDSIVENLRFNDFPEKKVAKTTRKK
jgi:hypothetical protein